MALVAALLRHPATFAFLSLGFLVLVVGMVLPTPANWTRSHDDQLVDVRAAAPLQWHPIAGTWTIGSISTSTSVPHLLDVHAWATNDLAFGFTSGSRAVFTLTSQDGRALQSVQHSTGSTTPLTGTIQRAAVFANVAPGAYHVRVRVQDAGGATISEASRDLILAQGSVGP